MKRVIKKYSKLLTKYLVKKYKKLGFSLIHFDIYRLKPITHLSKCMIDENQKPNKKYIQSMSKYTSSICVLRMVKINVQHIYNLIIKKKHKTINHY